jgi:predicted O-linked N-acetylglucosamine transferase (SPINDLY family)
LNRHPEAERCYRSALALQPAHAEALFNLGRLQTRQERFAEAAATFGQLVQAQPGDGEAQAELGIALAGLERWVAAEQCYRRALELGHRDSVVLDHLARALMEQGRPEAALAVLREAIALAPDAPRLLGNFLFTRNHVPGEEQPGLPPQAAMFDRAITAAASAGARTAWACEAEPAVLRVGFVSADLRRHPVASFLAGFAGHAGNHGLALHAYSTKAGEDAVTARLKPHFTAWRDLAGQSARQAAERIAQDGVHVLFDLSGHTAGNRLDVFALAPAPVQVTWLGVPATTGLDAIGFVLTDPRASRPGDEAWFSERFWPLPESWFCYSPLEPPPDVAALPAPGNGHVTFGSFNSMTKINDAVIRTWARLLHAAAGSRLLLRNWQLQDPALARQLQDRFAAHGIAPDRLQLEGPIVSLAGHLAQYARIDIALDTFPYVGGTTTTEALFMGVPVLTLRGSGRMLRLGESLLHQAGLPGWIAQDEDDYVAKGAAQAADLEALAAVRAGLRPHLATTALIDGERFARQFAQALWALWRAAPR